MAVECKENNIVLSGSIFENELLPIRTFLDTNKADIKVNCSACKDMHGAVIQLLLAHKAIHGCDFIFSDEKFLYQQVIEGFRTVEDDCNK